MIPENHTTLDDLIGWMQQNLGSFTGSANADTASLAFYSYEDRILCTAEVELEKGTVEWTYS
jgi:hypothetical protein